MQSFCLEDERGLEGAKTELFPLPGGSPGARKGTRKSFANQRGPPRWPPARLTAYFQCPLTTSMRAETLSKKSFEVKNLFETSRFQIPDGSTARIAEI